ncbi:MAG: hypothetical protein ACKOX3_07740 [Bacteroidota bacterium]
MKKIVHLFLFLINSAAIVNAQDSVTHKSLKIGLMMPLQLQEQLVDDTVTTDLPIPSTVLPSLQFYEGALMAAHRLSAGSVSFSIIDIGKDSAATITALQKPINDTCDVYIASVPANCNAVFMKYIKRCKRPVISLNSISQVLMKVNSGLWLATPSNLTQLKQFSGYMYNQDSTANFILVHRDDKKEEQLVNYIYTELDSITSKSSRVSKFNFKSGTWDAFKLKLKSKKENFVFVPTNDESFLTSVVEQLIANKGSYNITLCGLPSWEGFESISPLSFTELRTTIFNGYFIDYNLPTVKDFRQDYIDEYHVDPIPNSFIGFDLTNYLFQQMDSIGLDKIPSKENAQTVSGQSFQFERSLSGGCVENKFFNVLRYDRDRLTKLNK